ncbi:hypothetical protein MFIFM68171_09886 [Madurella fahalii]|uniref:Uncharacterized protein n=1 Tax=Madurella fahalii TaxID=1157608 RepID=A0ABQ0GPM8_9PEZI
MAVTPEVANDGTAGRAAIAKQLDESSSRLSQLDAELRDLSQSISRLHEEARALSVSLRKSLATNALATRSAWANLQGRATSAGWDGDAGDSDSDNDGYEDHHITLAQLQLEVDNLSKIVDGLARHAAHGLHEVARLRLQCADIGSRAESIGAQIRGAGEDASNLEVKTGKELDLVVEGEKELARKRDEIQLRLDELKLKKARKRPFRRLLALTRLTSVSMLCAMNGLDKEIGELDHQHAVRESEIRDARLQIQSLQSLISTLESDKGRAKDLAGACSELIRLSQKTLEESRKLGPQLTALDKAATQGALGLRPLQQRVTTIRRLFGQDWRTLEEKMRDLLQEMMKTGQSNPAKICQPLVESLEPPADGYKQPLGVQ